MAWPLAHMAGSLIVCAMDARRKQVYNALFLATGTGLERLTPDRAISLEDLGAELKNYENSKIVVGDGAKLCYNTLTEEGIPMALAPKHLRMQSALGRGPCGGRTGRPGRAGQGRGAGPPVSPPVSGGTGAACPGKNSTIKGEHRHV